MYILNKFCHTFNKKKQVSQIGENRIRWNFAKSKFQTFEPNSKFGGVNRQTIELLQNIIPALFYMGATWE